MKAKKQRSYYKSETQNRVFVYAITGTPAEIEEYKEAQGSNLVLDDETGAPLMFTTTFIGNNVQNVIKSEAGNYYIDRTAFDERRALAEAAGGDFAKSLADKMAEDFLNEGANDPVAETAPEKKETAIDEG